MQCPAGRAAEHLVPVLGMVAVPQQSDELVGRDQAGHEAVAPLAVELGIAPRSAAAQFVTQFLAISSRRSTSSTDGPRNSATSFRAISSSRGAQITITLPRSFSGIISGNMLAASQFRA